MPDTSPSNGLLDGRLILITGASRGIGRAAAIACAAAGAELIITGRTSGALEEVDDEIRAVGAKATIVELDQTDYAATPRLADAIASRWGRLDGFVANAGQLGQMAPMAHIEPDIWERTLSVNLPLSGFRQRRLTHFYGQHLPAGLCLSQAALLLGHGHSGALMRSPKQDLNQWRGHGQLKASRQI